MKPKGRNYWLLDVVAGWRMSSSSNISLTPSEGNITLEPLPGGAVILDSELTDSLACPVAIASDSPDRVLVLDAETTRVSVLDLTAKTVEAIEAFGGTGTDARNFRSPRGLTVLPSGSIAVADTGNRRVLLFTASPYQLLKIWQVEKPCAVAMDSCDNVYVLDRATRQVLRVQAGDNSLHPIFAEVLNDPQDLAVSLTGTVAVVDGRDAAATVVVLPGDGGDPVRISAVQSPVSVVFDDTGTLYVGTANSLVAKLDADPTQLDGYRFAGEGVTDIDGTVKKLAWVERVGLVALLKDNDTGRSYLATIDPAGSFRRSGTFETQSLDSGIENCTWHRIQVIGTVPDGTSLLVESSTGATPDLSLALISASIPAGADNPDWLIQSPPGRFLKLRFTLRSGGEISPQIHALKVYFPRESYLQYLPAVFQEDEESRRFLDRFLSIFQTSFDGFDQQIDTLWELFDPFSVSDKYFPWLADVLALPVDSEMPIEQKRVLLKSAFQTYLLRGTARGFEKVIQDYTGIASIRVLEHFRLRNWPFLALSAELDEGSRLWSRNFYKRLQVGVNSRLGSFELTSSPEPAMEPFDWGANQFTVFFPANPRTVSATSARIRRVVDREKPAHALANLCPVFPRMRVGVQATLGVDTVVGEVIPMVLSKTGRLGYDSVLSRSLIESEIRSLGVSPRPSIGIDARLL